MPRCKAFLRAVNVGGRVIKIAPLREASEVLGLANVTTFASAAFEHAPKTRAPFRSASTLRKLRAQLT